MKTTIIDIETGPLPEEQLTAIMPVFEKHGGIKDEAKQKAFLDNKKAEWMESAALSAQTGKILVIGMKCDDSILYMEGDEKIILTNFWEWYKGFTGSLVGHYIKSFDLPFIIRRSWIHKVNVCEHVYDGRYFEKSIIDTADRWTFGRKDTEHGSTSLDTISKCLGLPGKNGDGKNFAKLYASDKQAALDYLKNDLLLTESVAKAMQIV